MALQIFNQAVQPKMIVRFAQGEPTQTARRGALRV